MTLDSTGLQAQGPGGNEKETEKKLALDLEKISGGVL